MGSKTTTTWLTYFSTTPVPIRSSSPVLYGSRIPPGSPFSASDMTFWPDTPLIGVNP